MSNSTIVRRESETQLGGVSIRKSIYSHTNIYNVNINKLPQIILSSLQLKPGLARLAR